MKSLKYKLPTIHKFMNIFDINLLKEEAIKFDNKYLNIFESNQNLCLNNKELVKNVYDHFEQINLTVLDPNIDIDNNAQEHCMLEEDNTNSKTKVYKEKINKNVHPSQIEHFYNYPTEEYKNSYFYNCVSKFKSKAIRVRLVRLKSGKILPKHIDYDPSYAVRIIVPIFTNPQCINYFWNRNNVEQHYLENDGSAYFLNTGFAHSVENLGTTDRISLMFSLENYDDLEFLLNE